MVGGIPVHYRGGGEGVIASYDYTDIAEGTGVQNFYAITRTQASGTTKYELTGTVNYSYTLSTAGIAIENGISIEKDFDLTTFNMPKRIKGKCSVYIPWYLVVTGADKSTYVYITAKLRHWDGSTETEIASDTTKPTQSYSTTGSPYTLYSTLSFTCPLTPFKKGETLRLTIIGTTDAAGVGSTGIGTVTLHHDPKDATLGSFRSTQLKAEVPFVLDL